MTLKPSRPRWRDHVFQEPLEVPGGGLLPMPLETVQLPAHDAKSFEMRVQPQIDFRPERVVVWGTGLGVAFSELQLWIGDEVPSPHVPAGIFDRAAFGVRLQTRAVVKTGRHIVVKGEWKPPRRPVYKPRYAKWRGCWWVTHTKHAPDSISGYILGRVDR